MLDYSENCIGFGQTSEGTLHEFEDGRKAAIAKFGLFELEIGWEKAVGDIARAVFDPMCNVTSTSKSPGARFELATNGLTVHCSTTELTRNK